MTRERAHKSWREIDRAKDHSGPRRTQREADRRRDERARSNEQLRQAKSALEALFSPKSEKEQPQKPARGRKKVTAKVVLPPPPSASPEREKRRKVLAKLLECTSPKAITKTADEYLAAGFDFPEDQQVYLQLLAHSDEERVMFAMNGLLKLLAGEPAQRKHLMEQRLKRIEQSAEMPRTRDAASNLRRVLHGRGKLTAPSGGAR